MVTFKDKKRGNLGSHIAFSVIKEIGDIIQRREDMNFIFEW